MTGDTDPDYINSMEHFESMRHEEIYAKAQQIDAGQIVRASGIWLEVAGALTSAFPLTREGVDREIHSAGWSGAAADAAFESTRSFAASVDELAHVMADVSARLGGVAAAAEAVKIAVVPPGTSGPVGAIAALLESAKVIDAQAAQEAMRQEAVLAMNMVYKPAYRTAGTGVPALPPAPQPLDGTRAPQPAGRRTNGHPDIDGTDESASNGSAPMTDPGTAPSTPNEAPPPAGPEGSGSATPPNPNRTPEAPAPHPDTTGPQPDSGPAPEPPTPEPQQPPAEAPQPAPEPPTSEPQQPQAEAPSAPPIPDVPNPDLPEPPPIPEQGEAPQPPSVPEPDLPPAPPPIPGAGEPTLTDPGGQPGITGPIPDANPPSTTNQPGVVPSNR